MIPNKAIEFNAKESSKDHWGRVVKNGRQTWTVEEWMKSGKNGDCDYGLYF